MKPAGKPHTTHTVCAWSPRARPDGTSPAGRGEGALALRAHWCRVHSVWGPPGHTGGREHSWGGINSDALGAPQGEKAWIWGSGWAGQYGDAPQWALEWTGPALHRGPQDSRTRGQHGRWGGDGSLHQRRGNHKLSSYSFKRRQRKCTTPQTQNEPCSDPTTPSSCQAQGSLCPDGPLPLLVYLPPARSISLQLCSGQLLLSLQNLQLLPAATEGRPSSHVLKASSQAIVWSVPRGQQHGHLLGTDLARLMQLHSPSWPFICKLRSCTARPQLPRNPSPCTPFDCIPSAILFRSPGTTDQICSSNLAQPSKEGSTAYP